MTGLGAAWVTVKGYSGSDGTLVGDKYIRLALLAGSLLLCLVLLARLYFVKSERSSIL